MDNVKKKFKSVRMKLFLTVCIVVIAIVLFLIIINNVVLESFYLYSKTKNVRSAYTYINNIYNQAENGDLTINIENELNQISIKNDFDIIIENDKNITLYTSDVSFEEALQKINEYANSSRIIAKKELIIYKDEKVEIKRLKDELSSINYIMLYGTLDNGNLLYIRIPVASVQETVKVSNNLLILIGGVSIVIAGILASYISKKFTEPILELNEIAKNMSKLDFKKKYQEKNTNDEINELGKSINLMSDKLEIVIKQLRQNNIELEKDIEEKSQIDEMRKQFISDVSHELKTPIALIQGYAEGLVENVNSDEESRKFYAEVILDESNKMDKLVKQLLELMKLEYGKREFEDKKFDITELINEVIRKCNVMLQENKIEVEIDADTPSYVVADAFYMEQVITNYFTNAIKHADERDGRKLIKITVKENKKNKKMRISVYNTGENLEEEDLERIWKRFYKVDSSRNRENGGTGIGLALVKAIMNNYENAYGVENKPEGVEFYIELNKEE